MHYKTAQPERSLKGAQGVGVAEFVIATLNVVDSDEDVVLPGAIGRQTAPILPSHDWRSVPLGKATTEERGGKVLARAQFNLEVGPARDWFAALTFDLKHPPAKQEYSWGYDVLRSRPGTFQGRKVRFLERVEILEVSPVLRGASVGTGTISATFTPDELAAARRAEGKRLQEELRKLWLQSIRSQVLHNGLHEHPLDEDIARLQMVPAEVVPEAARTTAQVAAKAAAEHLRIGVPSIHWFFDPQGKTLGFAKPGGSGVFLDCHLPAARLLEVVAHECAHLAGADEVAATRYQKTFLDYLRR